MHYIDAITARTVMSLFVYFQQMQATIFEFSPASQMTKNADVMKKRGKGVQDVEPGTSNGQEKSSKGTSDKFQVHDTFDGMRYTVTQSEDEYYSDDPSESEEFSEGSSDNNESDIDEHSDRASSPDEVDSDDSSVKISLKSQLSCDPEMKQMMKEMMKEKRNGKLSN